jgi:hypothetical protein
MGLQYIYFRLLLSILTIVTLSEYVQAQCEFNEVMRADGTLNRNYEYATVYTSDTMSMRMSLAYQGAFRTLRAEFEYSDTIRTRFYKDIDLKLTDSTVVRLYFLSAARESSTGRTTCLYEIRQKELGYLSQFDMLFFIYKRKDGSLSSLLLNDNRDIMKLQLNCTRKK